MSYATLKYEVEGEIATLTFNRPEKRNAISAQMLDELYACLDETERDSSRVLIITALGKAFCAGMDLESLQKLSKQSPQENLEDSRRMAGLFYRIYAFPKPVIAAVNGAAVAGGCGIATVADFTLAAPEAKFGYTEAKIGFIPALVSAYLRRQVGEKYTRDLLLSGRIIGAPEALRMGLVTEIVPAGRLSARARELANSLLSASPASIARTKKLLLQFDEAALKSEIEQGIRENAEIRTTPDFREGLAAFLEKRAPKWKGH